MAAKKKNPNALHSLVMDVCAEQHASDPKLKAAFNLSSLVTKVEGVAVSIEPGIETALQAAEALASEQYKPFIEACLAAVQAGATLLPASTTPTPAAS